MAQFMLWGGQNRKTLTQVESDWQKGNLITHHKRNTTAAVIHDSKVGNISKAKLRQKDVNCYFISYWQSATINIFLSFLVTYHSLLFLVCFCLSVFWYILLLFGHSFAFFDIALWLAATPISKWKKSHYFWLFCPWCALLRGGVNPDILRSGSCIFETLDNDIKCVLSFKDSNFNEKISHLHTVRGGLAWP